MSILSSRHSPSIQPRTVSHLVCAIALALTTLTSCGSPNNTYKMTAPSGSNTTTTFEFADDEETKFTYDDDYIEFTTNEDDETVAQLKNLGATTTYDSSDDFTTSTTISPANSLTWNVGTTSLRLNTVTSGSWTSPVLSVASGNQAKWSTLAWTTRFPHHKELPSNAQSESTTTYPDLPNSTLMSGNVFLLHLNNSWTDVSANALSGTAAGNATFSSATYRLGTYAATFDGTGDSVSYGDVLDSAWGASGDFTVAMWIKMGGNVDTDKHALISKYASGQMGWMFGLRQNGVSNNLYYEAKSGGGNPSGYNSTALTSGTWYHVAMTRDTVADTMTFYLNGAADGTVVDTGTDLSNALNLVIGGDTAIASGAGYNGFIDEVAIWSRALTVLEINHLYQRGATQIKFWTRSWTDASHPDCDDGTEVGCPDFTGVAGSATTAYGEGTQTTSPSATLTTTSSASVTGRYFQVKADFTSDSTAFSPSLASLSVTNDYFPATIPCMELKEANYVEFLEIISFADTLATGSAGEALYQLVFNGNVVYTLDGKNLLPALSTTPIEAEMMDGDMLTTLLAGYKTPLATVAAKVGFRVCLKSTGPVSTTTSINTLTFELKK